MKKRLTEKSFGDSPPRLKTPTKDISLIFNILIKKDDQVFIAHCLELDIVTTADTVDQAQKDLVALICAQVDYAFTNDNLDNLYSPAPSDVWEQFFACEEAWEEKHKIDSGFRKGITHDPFVPSRLIAKTCLEQGACRA